MPQIIFRQTVISYTPVNSVKDSMNTAQHDPNQTYRLTSNTAEIRPKKHQISWVFVSFKMVPD